MMNVKVLFFAGLRESLGVASDTVRLMPGTSTVGALRDLIAARGVPWSVLATMPNLRVAVNQQVVDFDATIKSGDEVAFFPPVTGG